MDDAQKKKVMLAVASVVGVVALVLISYNLYRFLNPPRGVVGGGAPVAVEPEPEEQPSGRATREPVRGPGGTMIAPN